MPTSLENLLAVNKVKEAERIAAVYEANKHLIAGPLPVHPAY